MPRMQTVISAAVRASFRTPAVVSATVAPWRSSRIARRDLTFVRILSTRSRSLGATSSANSRRRCSSSRRDLSMASFDCTFTFIAAIQCRMWRQSGRLCGVPTLDEAVITVLLLAVLKISFPLRQTTSSVAQLTTLQPHLTVGSGTMLQRAYASLFVGCCIACQSPDLGNDGSPA